MVSLPRGGPDGGDLSAHASVCLALQGSGRNRRLQPAERMDRLVGGTADGRALRRLSQPAQPAGLPAQHRPPDWMDLQRGLPAARRDRAAGDALCRVGGQALDPGGGPAARQRQVHRRHHSQDVPQGSAGLSGGLPRRKLWFSAAGRIAFQRRADHQRVSHPAPLRSPDQPALPAEAIRPGDPRHGRGSWPSSAWTTLFFS